MAKRFQDGTEALRDCRLELKTGELVALVGPSGCGKSTLLRIVADLLVPSAGALVWPAGRGEIGFVFQEPTLLPWADVRDNVWLPLRLRGRSRAAVRDEIDAALDLVGLQGWADVRPHQLSGGMKMRASIARALVTHPGLLLMDEPFAALDELTRTRLDLELLRLWATQGWTVLFVTHSVQEAVFLATRVLVMSPRPGTIAAEIRAGPQPRTPDLKLEIPYQRLCRDVSAALEHVGGAAP